jgi:hypothetical protein
MAPAQVIPLAAKAAPGPKAVDPLTGFEGTEIQRIWADVNKLVCHLAASAGVDPSETPSNLDIDGVLKYLDKAAEADKKSSEKFMWVKNVFHRTLQCIETVGGIVSNGASYVR